MTRLRPKVKTGGNLGAVGTPGAEANDTENGSTGVCMKQSSDKSALESVSTGEWQWRP
jgi:hypothetical protein